MRCEGNYVDGKLNGKMPLYFENGAIKHIDYYLVNAKVTRKEWYEA